MNSVATLHRVCSPGGERALKQSMIARPTSLYQGVFDHRILEDLNPQDFFSCIGCLIHWFVSVLS